MGIRTDLAVELRELNPELEGVNSSQYEGDGYKATVIEITTDGAAEKMGRPKGRYVTLESDAVLDAGMGDEMCDALVNELKRMLPGEGTVLVAGLGNPNATPDAIGPQTAFGIFATRHIGEELAKELNLNGMRSVAAVAPGVLGQTGMEALEIISGAVERVSPAAVVAVDALAARRLSRIGRTVQLCDSGILPGSGVGNRRSEISEKTLGVKVISLGIPTVADADTIIEDAGGNKNGDESGMIVTAPGIDTVVMRSAAGLSRALNFAMQPDMDRQTLLSLT